MEGSVAARDASTSRLGATRAWMRERRVWLMIAGPALIVLLAVGYLLLSQGVVRTDDAMVSRRNCKISVQGGRWSVEDLNSANGTFINGASSRPVEATRLRHGDRLASLWPQLARSAPGVHWRTGLAEVGTAVGTRAGRA